MPFDRTVFNCESVVMKMYTADSTLYIKLSSAGLALTVTFAREILGQSAPLVPDIWLKWVWGAFLFAIGAGAFYNYLAGKYMENLSPRGAGFTGWNWLQPGYVYGAMLLAFYLGAAIFTIHAIYAKTTAPNVDTTMF